jgi:hemolysin activation/secretion protein
MIVKALSREILARGCITTRVLLPEQDLTTGTLTLSLIPGVIRQVRFADEKLRGTWKTAFPAGDGEVLNLCDLESAKRVKRSTPGWTMDGYGGRSRSCLSAGNSRVR